MNEHQDGWLQDVFKAAKERVDSWPDWKKASDAKRAECESHEPKAPEICEPEIE